MAPPDNLARAMRAGDWKYIASFLRNHAEVPEMLRHYLADVLEGKKKRSNNRPATEKLRHQAIARYIRATLLLRALKNEPAHGAMAAAEDDAMAKFGKNGRPLNRRTVQRIYREEEAQDVGRTLGAQLRKAFAREREQICRNFLSNSGIK